MKLFKNLQQLIRQWLGIPTLEQDITSLRKRLDRADIAVIDVAVHRKAATQIIIASRLGAGYVKIIDVYDADLKEIKSLIRSIENQYQPRNTFIDAPHYLKDILDI